MYSAFDGIGYSLFDMGGDDAGATVMGQFFRNMKSKEYDMLYVINGKRAMIENVHDAAHMLYSIETASRLKATYIVNNTHLKDLTDTKTILDSMEYAKKVSEAVKLPILCTTYPESLIKEQEISATGAITRDLYPVQVFVKTPWEVN
jgi:hypothetical protein